MVSQPPKVVTHGQALYGVEYNMVLTHQHVPNGDGETVSNARIRSTDDSSGFKARNLQSQAARTSNWRPWLAVSNQTCAIYFVTGKITTLEGVEAL
jgi:hypothetical protein